MKLTHAILGILLALVVSISNAAAPFVVHDMTVNGMAIAPTPAVGTNSTQMATMAAIVQHNTPCQSILDYGGHNDGATPNDAAWLAIIAAQSPTNICIYLPQGTYIFTNQATYTMAAGIANITIFGAGSELTYIKCNNTTAGTAAIQINFNGPKNSARIRDMTFLAPMPGNTFAIHWVQQLSAAGGGGGYDALSDISNVTFRGSDGWIQSNYFAQAIENEGVSNITYYNDTFQGPNTINGGGLDLNFAVDHTISPVIYNVLLCNFTDLQVGITYGGGSQGLAITGSNLTGDNIGIWVPTIAAIPDQLSIVNSQLNNRNSVLVQSRVQGVIIANNLIFTQDNNTAIAIGAATDGMSITGNVFAPFTGTPVGEVAISVTAAQNQGAIITGNLFGPITTGVNVGGASLMNVQANQYTPSIVNKVLGSGTCTSCSIGVATQ